MNTTKPSPNPAGDDLDRLFAAYFQAEMPTRWPPAPRPWLEMPRVANTSPKTDSSHRSRWALAASVALLVGSCWYLSGHISDGQPKKPFDPDGTASPSVIDKNLGKGKPDPKAAPIPGMP